MGKNRKSKAMATHFAGGQMNNNPPGNYGLHTSGIERSHQSMPTSSYQSGYHGSDYQSNYQESTYLSDYQGSHQSFSQDAYHLSSDQRFDQSPTYNRSQRQQKNEKQFAGGQWNTSPPGTYSSETYGSERTYKSPPSSTYQNTYQDTNQLYSQDSYQHSQQHGFDQGPKFGNAKNRRCKGKGKSFTGGQRNNNPVGNYSSHENNNPVGNYSSHGNDNSMGNYSSLDNNNPMGNYSLNAASNSAGNYSLNAASNPTGNYSSHVNGADGSYQSMPASTFQNNYQDTNEFYSQSSFQNSEQVLGQSQTVKTRKNRKRKPKQKSSLGGQANNNPTRNYGLRGNNSSTGNFSLHTDDSPTGNYSLFVNDTGLSNDSSYQGIDQSYSQDSYQFSEQQGFYQSQDDVYSQYKSAEQKFDSSQISHGSYDKYYDQPLNNDTYSITPQQRGSYPSTLTAGAPRTSSTPRSHRLGFGPYPQSQLESAKDSMKGFSKPQQNQRKRKMGQNANVGQSKAKAPKKMSYNPGSCGSAGTSNGGNAGVGGGAGFAATGVAASAGGVAGFAGRGTGPAGRVAGSAGRGTGSAGRGKNKRKKAPAAAGKAGTAATDNRWAATPSHELDINQSGNQGTAAENTAQFQRNTEDVIQRIADKLNVVLNQQRMQNSDQGNRLPSTNTEAIIQTIADRIGSGMMQQEMQMEPFMDALPESLGLLLQSVSNDPDAMEQLEQELYQRGPEQKRKSKPQSVYKCDYCPFSSPKAQDAREHLKIANHYAVSHCKCEISDDGNSEVLEITQPIAMKNKLAYLKSAIVVCWECGMVFQDIYQCAWHTKSSHRYGKGAYCISNVVAENTFLLEECQHCKDCNLVFRNKKDFQQHKKSDGSKSGGQEQMPSDCIDKKTFQIFSCMYCDQVFRSDTWSSGFSHLKTHKSHTRTSIAFHVSDFELPQQQVQVPPVRLNGQDGYYEFEKQLLVRLVTHLSKMCGEKKARKRVRDKLKNMSTFKKTSE